MGTSSFFLMDKPLLLLQLEEQNSLLIFLSNNLMVPSVGYFFCKITQNELLLVLRGFQEDVDFFLNHYHFELFLLPQPLLLRATVPLLRSAVAGRTLVKGAGWGPDGTR